MPLHPEIARVLGAIPERPEGVLDPESMRALEEADAPPVAARVPVYGIDDAVVPSESGGIPVRIYTPARAGSFGIIVYFHGGAFFLGSLETHDHVARLLASETGCKVVSVGYRLAPEHPFPAGLDDCLTTVRWVAGGGDSLGWDRRTLAVAGDSSGGNFAAAVAALAHDDGLEAITHQILYYPSLDLDFELERYASLRENAVGYGLETAGLRPFNAFYLNSGADPSDPRVSPIKRRDLTGLPAALILTGEFDPLRDEAELYGQRLRQSGVRTMVSRYAGAGHGFVQHFSWLPEYRRAFTETREFLR